MTQTLLSPTDSEPASADAPPAADTPTNPAAHSGVKVQIALVDPDAVRVVERLRRFGHKAYVVGGCVRDLLLGGKPKDFDIATSATPNDLRRLFRNCRIIGRRFRLAHIFFGSKIIETSTFRANPRDGEDENAESQPAPTAPESDRSNADLLIRRDNVFGTEEQDARRRDFTVNGLFLDVETGEVIDHVEGLPDINARLVRTIGDPDVRFREDPVRILRAVKFAARCNLTIEPETYQRMIEHAGEVAKCAAARVSEEFFRLLRAGAGRRSMELLAEAKLLEVMVPTLATWLRLPDDADEALARQHKNFWSYLDALDRLTQKRGAPPTNALIVATLCMAALRDAVDPDAQGVRDIGQRVAEVMAPMVLELKASRRDTEMGRQILLAMRHTLPGKGGPRRRFRVGHRELADDVLRLLEIVCDAEGIDRAAAGLDKLVEEMAPPPAPALPLLAEPQPIRDARGLTPIPDLSPLAPARHRPSFLGTGAFGSAWARSVD